MTIDSVETLLGLIRRVQLLAPEQVDEVARELGPCYADPLALAQYLVEIDWLTTHQVRVLFEGDPNDLVIGPYTLLDRLGEGGVSEVFKAWDGIKGRIVALKVLRNDLGSHPEAIRQFQRELQAVTRLNHPNIIKTHDAHLCGNLHYFAMEFVEGVDLDRHVRASGPLPVELACEYVRQAALGLQHAHQLGLVHRDIKPANLSLTNPPATTRPAAVSTAPRRAPDPVVKILDWGLARLEADRGAAAPSSSDNQALDEDALLGTVDFLAPEQARDSSLVDIRADIYSLGCTFYFLLTGRPPFPGPSAMQKILQHQQDEPTPVQQLRPEVPEEVAAIVHKMMAKLPGDRFQIPLLVVAPMRRYCPGALGAAGSVIRPAGLSDNSILRPSSGTALERPPSGTDLDRPGTAAELNRPSTATNLQRPSTATNHERPSTATHLERPTAANPPRGNGRH